MPGVVMDGPARNETVNVKEEVLSPPADFGGSNGVSKDVKMEEQPPRAVPPSDLPNGTVNGSMNGYSQVEAIADGVPPDIDHITQGYQPLGLLISRLCQETYNELLVMIDEMADLNIQPSYGAGLVNGAGEANAKKKLKFINWAQDKSAQFVKLLVIAQWSRQSVDVSRVIDLKVWLDMQRQLYDDAGGWLGEVKRSLGQAKIPNPDLQTALGVLTTGKVSTAPSELDQYIPTPRLPASELLKSLRNLNTLLHIRLNLHEDLPPYFQDFKIASGRATFFVKDEFEVDLAIASEDPNSQFRFIDFRLIFSPTALEVPDGIIRDGLVGRADEILGTEGSSGGLSGCFHFLHDFVLTHKINVLRMQAHQMARGRWSDSIMVDMARRTLVIQYWLKKPGGKHWIEIGIHKGIQSEDAPSKLHVRWIKSGKPVDKEIPINEAELSAETILQTVVAFHIQDILSSAKDLLMANHALYAQSKLKLGLEFSETDPCASRLVAQANGARNLMVSIEPTSGQVNIQPTSIRMMQVQEEVNKKPDVALEINKAITYLRADLEIGEIETAARLLGWDVLYQPNLRRDDLKRFFPQPGTRVIYIRRPNWAARWSICLAVGTNGEEWSVVELSDTTANAIVNERLKIPTSHIDRRDSASTVNSLCVVEQVAIGIAQYYDIGRSLRYTHVGHAYRTRSGLNRSLYPYLQISLRSLLGSQPEWSQDKIQLEYQGLESDGTITFTAELKIPQATKEVRDVVSKSSFDKDIHFQKLGNILILRFRYGFGDLLPTLVREKIQRLNRVILYATIIRKLHLKIQDISLSHITLRYSGQRFTCTLQFPSPDDPIDIILSDSNPHHRIRPFLLQLLNNQPLPVKRSSASLSVASSFSKAIEQAFVLLPLTLPLLTTLSNFESLTSSPSEYSVLPRSHEWFSLLYTQVGRKLDIRLRPRGDILRWYITEETAALADAEAQANAQARRDTIDAAVADLFAGTGDDWIGCKEAIIAGPRSVSEILTQLNEVFLQASRIEAPPKPKREVVELD